MRKCGRENGCGFIKSTYVFRKFWNKQIINSINMKGNKKINGKGVYFDSQSEGMVHLRKEVMIAGT